ncbi:MAG: hypothetical protein MI725_03960 [Pirellulales bacterium]|nr:hypothetical protein [Pirellulales bacterium]
MASVMLFLLAPTVGVVFGWQPMSDGSPRYEYLVQLEPELVATLEAGESIPITSDIPAEVGPIGRLRIVVGRGDLPRQQLVTQMKPWPETAEVPSRDRILETQFTAPARDLDRYGSSAKNAAQILPPKSDTPQNSNAFARSLQQGARQASNPGAQPLRGRADQILPPPDNGLRHGGEAVQAEARQLFESGTPRAENGRPGDRSILRNRGQNIPDTGGIAPPFAGADPPSPSVGAILPPDSSDPPSIDPRPITSQNVRLDQTIEKSGELPAASRQPPNDTIWRDHPNFATANAENAPGASWPADPPSTPAIRAGMLKKPADAPLETVGPLAVGGERRVESAERRTENSSRVATQREEPRAPQSPEPSTLFPLILSWVLLSGSGAGNLYLFWSYLDVRSKYRDMIHGWSHRSAERNPEYD